MFENIPFVIVGIIGLSYSFGILQINRKYFENRLRIEQIRKEYKGRSKPQRIVGYIVVISLFITSIVLFLLLLSIL